MEREGFKYHWWGKGDIDASFGIFFDGFSKILTATGIMTMVFGMPARIEMCIRDRDEAQQGFDFKITPGFHTPEWAKGAVMYQIFVDRFCNGDKSNDVETCEYVYIGRPVQRVEDWGRNPSAMDVGYFYGGD